MELSVRCFGWACGRAEALKVNAVLERRSLGAESIDFKKRRSETAATIRGSHSVSEPLTCTLR